MTIKTHENEHLLNKRYIVGRRPEVRKIEEMTIERLCNTCHKVVKDTKRKDKRFCQCYPRRSVDFVATPSQNTGRTDVARIRRPRKQLEK
jgi:hypothetical protein